MRLLIEVQEVKFKSKLLAHNHYRANILIAESLSELIAESMAGNGI